MRRGHLRTAPGHTSRILQETLRIASVVPARILLHSGVDQWTGDRRCADSDPFEAQKAQFQAAKEIVELSGGDTEVLERYHTTLVAPFCLSAVKSFFDAQ